MPDKRQTAHLTKDEISRFLGNMDEHYPLKADLSLDLVAQGNYTITRLIQMIKVPYGHAFKGGRDDYSKLEQDMIALKAYDYYMPIVMEWYNGLKRQRQKLHGLIESSP
jgi:hypothetical protein